jgi:hypothetical protein
MQMSVDKGFGHQVSLGVELNFGASLDLFTDLFDVTVRNGDRQSLFGLASQLTILDKDLGFR